MKTKTFDRVDIKDESTGTVTAVFATLGVVDRDGDVTVKGAFTDGAPVVISAYGHRSWEGELPVGKGVIREDGDEAILEGEFFLSTTHGRDAFETVKALSESGLQEWSYSLENVESERGEVDGKRVNILRSIEVKEVSPVLRGAGIDTRTLVAKGAGRKVLNSQLSRLLSDVGRERWGSDTSYVYPADFDVDEGYVIFNIYSDDEADRLIRVEFTYTDDSVELGDEETEVERVTDYAPKGAKFSDHLTRVVAQVEAVTARAQEVVALRAEKGKSISDESAAQLKELAAAIAELVDTPTPPPDHVDELQALFLRDVARTQGVTL